ncbi:AAA family ATPase [Terasakiispira papahanaumokuakeensis]|uniref:AAA family ATPase n=2 Tax=Terasakiispira papahanaumokuakeensis TaxID=197479 RepID=A0A1E2VFC9_9GAMM|nr:AAA family ATPase [Terasakiispira papahanaumokuakeensis]
MLRKDRQLTMSVHQAFIDLKTELEQQIIGQQALIERLLIALLADGHLLVEGAPGLAKTRAIKALAERLDVGFQRIQFTPDLLPADLTGTEVFHPDKGEFSLRPGPIFHDFLLADEINRAPAKVQSALLEAMAERQVSIAGRTLPLGDVFLVMATQNPLEQEGTYPLPEAQLDRFLMHVWIDYPDSAEELAIMRLVRKELLQRQQADHSAHPTWDKMPREAILDARQQVLNLHMAEAVEHYIVALVQATRRPEVYDEQLAQWLRFGASPRAVLALERCSRARAWLAGRDHVLPEDVQVLAADILRHRLLRDYSAEAEGISLDSIIQRLLALVPVA